MNVFHKFTLMSLRKNRSRTLVTIIGIMLSMAMVTAVFQAANSGLEYLMRAEAARTGAFHAYYLDVNYEDIENIRNTKGIKDTAWWQQVGWAEIGSENEAKPYLLIESVSDNFEELVAVNIISGRMPENEYEILLPEHLSYNGGVSYDIGDVITMSVGERTSDGYTLTSENMYVEGNEEITNASERTYTVVGIYSRFDYAVEEYSCPGYVALTKNCGAGSCNVFFTVKKPSRFYSYVEDNGINYEYHSNRDLLAYSGSFRNGSLTVVMYGLVAVLIFLIAFGSISLIYNSFSISVSERTKQFGILKSVGATKKQIRGSVLYEALVLCAVGIPLGMIAGCVGIGVTLWCLRDSFSAFWSAGESVKMYLVINPEGLIVSAAVCLITTLISAWIPAKKAIRISAIEAIRQTSDVRIKGKDVRTWSITKKLFGFEGMLASKNFGRNKKRYRATVISLFLSVALFISASSFSAYLKDTVGGVASASGSNEIDIEYRLPDEAECDLDEIMELLLNADGVEKGVYYRLASGSVYFDAGTVDSNYKKLPLVIASGDEYLEYAYILFLDDKAFMELCRNNNLNPEDYMNPEAPAAIACDNIVNRYSENNMKEKYYKYNIFDRSSMPVSGYASGMKEIEGYEYYTSIEEGDSVKYYYYPTDYLDEYWYQSSDDPSIEIDESRALVLSDDEAVNKTNITIKALLKETPYYVPDKNSLNIIYPYSVCNAVWGEEGALKLRNTEYILNSKNHAQAYEEITKVLYENGITEGYLYDRASEYESERTLLMVINVFSYGFIILISLIAMANVFNTISTNVSLRRREFAMLKSVGLTNRGFRKMMNFECIIYGVKGLAWGLPASVLMTFLIYRVTEVAMERSFYIPWYSIAIAVGSVFAVVFATMLYSTNKIRKDNPIDALKNENL